MSFYPFDLFTQKAKGFRLSKRITLWGQPFKVLKVLNH